MTNPWYPLLDYPYESYPLCKMHKRNPRWQKRRLALEHGLIVVAVFGFIFHTAQAVGTVILTKPKMILSTGEAMGNRSPVKELWNVTQQSCDEDVCVSPECIHTASTILKNMDHGINPCDNFYRFACGGFRDSTFIPDGEGAVTLKTILKDKIKAQLRALVAEPSKPNDRKPFRLLKNLYKSCMNTTAIEDQGLEPLHKILKKLGGWPVLVGKMWNETDFDWIDAIYKFRDIGISVNYFFTLHIIRYFSGGIQHRLSLDPPKFRLDMKYLLKGFNNENVKAYYSDMMNIAVLLGAERELASTELTESLKFEIKLAEISQSIKRPIHASQFTETMTLDVLMNNWPSIPWEEYFNRILPKNIILDENDVVIVKRPRFFFDLEKLLCKTPKRVQANYVIWRAVADSLSFLNATALNSNTNVGSSRWKNCFNLISKYLPISLSAMYVRRYLNDETKQAVVDIFMDVKNQSYKSLEQIEWIDNGTHKDILETTAAQTYNYIAYPDELLDDIQLEKFYENLELSGGNLYESILNVSYFDVEYSLSKLRKPVNSTDWVTLTLKFPPTEITAWSGMINGIVISGGMVKGLYFNSNRPRYMNYGSIGGIIGHELTHPIRFIAYLDLNNSTASTIRTFSERVQCVINQYGNYTVEEVGLQLNGRKTQEENVADITGIKMAYRAYNDWAKKHKPEKKLPGLPYSPNQMFWISAASFQCGKHTPKDLIYRMKSTRYSTDEFRVLGPISNMPEFSKDFSCPIGSKMNPEKKCSVW